MRRKRIILPLIIALLVVIGIIMMGGYLMKKEIESYALLKIDGLMIPTPREAMGMLPESFFGEPVPGGSGFRVLPSSYNISLAAEKHLTTPTEFGEKYLYMQALYRKAFEQYLSERLSLQQFDDILANSDMRFVPMRVGDFHQEYSTFGFKYIYLRDNLAIERLSKEELYVLQTHIKAGRSDIPMSCLSL